MNQNFFFRQAAVIGAGTMGRDIVMCLANAGLNVQWLDSNPQMPNQVLDAVADTYVHNVRQGCIGEEEAVARRARIAPTQYLAAMREANLVIEAVYENLELRQSIFRELDVVLKSSVVLASNTFYLDIDAIAAVTARLGQALGLHFFSPAHIMRLLRTVHSARTVSTVLEAALALGEQMGKAGVVAGNCHGFIGNRMLEPYATGTRLMLLEGTLPYQVDRTLQALGFVMGPLRTYDVVGIDLGWRTRKLAGVGQDQPAMQVDNRLCKLGRFGQKSGVGYYRYAPDSRQAEYDTEVDVLVLRVVETLGYPWRDFVDEEILERRLPALANEDAKILDEGIAARSADIDTVYLNGYGFPATEGGPMVWADRLGVAELLQRPRFLGQCYGTRWKPASLVERLIAEDGAPTDLQETR